MKNFRIQKMLSLLALTLFSSGAMAQGSVVETVTTMADGGESGMYVATFCPKKDVAIGKDDAEVFSIYLDSGKPILMKLRVRSGKFIIKAGEAVVVKTTEAKDVILSSTNKSSSIFLTDLVCLSADQKVADYRKAHSVADDATFYLLTNMASNGGFGFTKFTGDMMKKDNFFIVIPKISKTRAAVDIEDGDPVPFLEGEAGNDDGFTAQSVFAKGDANGDGKINVADIVEMVNYITGKPSTSFLFGPADVNSDKAVNTTDIELTLNTIMSKN